MKLETLTPTQRKFFSELVEYASDLVNRRICNDIPEEIISILNEEDKKEMVIAFDLMNTGGKEEEDKRFTPFDWIWLSFLSHLLAKDS